MDDEFRKCEFCGCLTNAKLRACCDKGRAADKASVPPDTKARTDKALAKKE